MMLYINTTSESSHSSIKVKSIVVLPLATQYQVVPLLLMRRRGS